MNLFTKWDALSAKALFNGLVFFAPVALLVRTTAGVSYSQFFSFASHFILRCLFDRNPRRQIH